MSQWGFKGFWELVQGDKADENLPRFLTLQELGPVETPSVPCSLPAELLDRDWPEQEASCMQTCNFICGNQAPSLLSSKPAINPRVNFAKKAKASLSDSTVQAEPVIRSPVACSRVRDRTSDRTSSQADNLCSHWCGPDCAAQFKEVSLLLSRPTFGRPPQHGGIGAPEDIDFRRPDECDPCSAILWARPSDCPSLPPDSPVDDMADSNRQTARPKFWWKDLDDEEGLEELVRQIHMPEETFSWLPAPPQANSPQSSHGESHLLIPPPSPVAKPPAPPNHSSHSSLNSILHKPGTRSPSVDQHVSFTLSPQPKSQHQAVLYAEQKPDPANPLTRNRARSAPPVRPRSDSVLWHLIPGS